jgi:hypothetical protein
MRRGDISTDLFSENIRSVRRKAVAMALETAAIPA